MEVIELYERLKTYCFEEGLTIEETLMFFKIFYCIINDIT